MTKPIFSTNHDSEPESAQLVVIGGIGGASDARGSNAPSVTVTLGGEMRDGRNGERLEISEKQKERDGKLRQRRITVQYVW